MIQMVVNQQLLPEAVKVLVWHLVVETPAILAVVCPGRGGNPTAGLDNVRGSRGRYAGGG